MSEFDTLIVDELRREFRRTRPPAKVITDQYIAGIFRVTSRQPPRIGYRVFWYPSSLLHPDSTVYEDTQFDLIEPLPL
ncbi:hypothetical protein [Spirosoma rhododendri]|uniref:Uncharacterized protein n=1 Tax=Spirosoma rhododendri TaxID=2728024 RepID=A0A7L5DVG5_9BACT|nr:hypothetical protein [Spirosoma rhododendri]QJD79540.1 hypothetical protein HH216_14810 [Spirosoma rhododendri]